MNMVTLVMLSGGAVLVYAGIKGVDPRDVIKDAISGKDNPGTREEAPAPPASYNPTMPEEDTGSARV